MFPLKLILECSIVVVQLLKCVQLFCDPMDCSMPGFPVLHHLPGERNGNVLQYSCLENPIDRGAWWAIVHRVAKSDIAK